MVCMKHRSRSHELTLLGVVLTACMLSCLPASVGAAAVINSMQKGIVNGKLSIAINFRDWSGNFAYNLTLAASALMLMGQPCMHAVHGTPPGRLSTWKAWACTCLHQSYRWSCLLLMLQTSLSLARRQAATGHPAPTLLLRFRPQTPPASTAAVSCENARLRASTVRCVCHMLRSPLSSSCTMHMCHAALPLGTPPQFFWYQNAYELLTACSSVPAAQCCSGVGRAISQNSTQYDGTVMKFNSAAYQLFSLDVGVRHFCGQSNLLHFVSLGSYSPWHVCYGATLPFRRSSKVAAASRLLFSPMTRCCEPSMPPA